MKNILVFIIIVAVVACIVMFCIGFNKGKKENFASARIEAENSFDTEIVELQQQIKTITENYNSQIVLLQRGQASEIIALEKKNESAIDTLEMEQTSEIDSLRKLNTEVIELRQSEFNLAINTERNSSYLKGQIDARAAVQRQIDGRAQINADKNDWNAPVFSTRR